jgi:hypothetical protein
MTTRRFQMKEGPMTFTELGISVRRVECGMLPVLGKHLACLFLGNLLALFARFREANGDRLLATFKLFRLCHLYRFSLRRACIGAFRA